MTNYYDTTYFKWQKKAGEYGANQDLWMYKDYVKPSDTVLDFGCGGGYMLKKLHCKNKYGIDINPVARKLAKEKDIHVFQSIKQLPKNVKFDVIISHHTLEHVTDPANILKQLRIRLKKNGTIICVVPIDDWRTQKKYNAEDINQHLYTWTSQLLGNLFVTCGYKINSINILSFMWLPLSRYYYRYIPKPLYYFMSRIWSEVILSRQIRIVAQI